MNPRLDRYAGWLDRRREWVLGVGALVALVGALLAAYLPLRADLSNLLPPNARSVRDLGQIQARTPALGLVLCAVAGDDPALRRRATHRLADRLRALDGSLVAQVVADEGEGRRYAWQHRFLFAPVADLEAGRDALAERLRRAKGPPTRFTSRSTRRTTRAATRRRRRDSTSCARSCTRPRTRRAAPPSWSRATGTSRF